MSAPASPHPPRHSYPPTSAEPGRSHPGARDADPDEASLSVSLRARDTDVVIQIAGELDLHTGPALTTALPALIPRRNGGASAPTLVFDLSALTFLDTTGLAALTDGLAGAARRGWHPRYAAPQPHVRMLLTLAIAAGWLPDGLEHTEIPPQPGPGPAP